MIGDLFTNDSEDFNKLDNKPILPEITMEMDRKFENIRKYGDMMVTHTPGTRPSASDILAKKIEWSFNKKDIANIPIDWSSTDQEENKFIKFLANIK